jgi:DNA-directed RNA polymerase II subunit RPB1
MRGFITPVNRNGINRVKDVSVLRKASYEETADILFGAAAFGEKDYLKGISEKIIFGQAVEAGTSSFKIIIDTDEVDKYKAKAGIDKNEILGEQGNHDMISER